MEDYFGFLNCSTNIYIYIYIYILILEVRESKIVLFVVMKNRNIKFWMNYKRVSIQLFVRQGCCLNAWIKIKQVFMELLIQNNLFQRKFSSVMLLHGNQYQHS
jgi:hypothetical protein